MNNDFLDKIFDSKPTTISSSVNYTLEDLPQPDWQPLLDVYDSKVRFLSFKTVLPIFFSRGCPYSCAKYCTYPLEQGTTVDYRSVQNVINEISHIYKTLGVNHFIFRDPVFSINRSKVIELCNELLKLDFKIYFTIETHLKLIDEELASKLYKAGLRLIYVGIESSSDEVCKTENRVTEHMTKQFEKIRMLESNGIDVKVMYILGFPSETAHDLKESKRVAKMINALYVQLNIFTPYPGTEAFNELKDIIIEKRMEKFNQSNLTFKHRYYSESSVKKELSNFYIQYYIRPRWLLKACKSFFKKFLRFLFGN